MIITISGLIGSGKSTLAENLCTVCGYTLMPEPVHNNPFLNKYYDDPHRYALDMQIFLMFERVKQTQEAYLRSLRGETIVLDSNVYSDMAFAKVQDKEKYFIPEEFELYKNIYNYMTVSLPKPDIFFWLELKSEDALKRINQRARDCESGISIEYLNDLYEAYQDVINDMKTRCKVVELDAKKSRSDIIFDAMNIINQHRI